MKHKIVIYLAICFLACTTNFSCVTHNGGNGREVKELFGLDEAIEAAVSEIEANVVADSEITVSRIVAPREEIGNFLAEELSARLNERGTLKVLAREAALRLVVAEHQFQMSGYVSDASAVGIGHFLGAKAIVTGSFERYEDFSQFRLRIVDVETAALIVSWTARLRNDDPVLVNITVPLKDTRGINISEQALVHLNRGKELYAEEMFDGAIGEFNRALTINNDLAEAYFYRGNAILMLDNDYNLALSDYTQAIKLDQNFASAYKYRGQIHSFNMEQDKAIADYTQAIRLDPYDVDSYLLRGNAYGNNDQDDRAFVDYTLAIKVAPDNPYVYWWRGSKIIDKWESTIEIVETNQTTLATINLPILAANGLRKIDIDWAISELNVAIADLTQVIRLDSNYLMAYLNRGYLYYFVKGDYDQAAADYTSAIKISQNYAPAYYMRGNMYFAKKDYSRAIADFELAISLDPDYAKDDDFKNRLENARRLRR